MLTLIKCSHNYMPVLMVEFYLINGLFFSFIFVFLSEYSFPLFMVFIQGKSLTDFRKWNWAGLGFGPFKGKTKVSSNLHVLEGD